MKIALITGCVAGVAQSKMAAVAIKKEAESRGFDVFVEEQGGHKLTKKLTDDQIADSDIVIIASAIAITGKQRFMGKKILELNVSKALMNPVAVLDKAYELFKK